MPEVGDLPKLVFLHVVGNDGSQAVPETTSNAAAAAASEVAMGTTRVVMHQLVLPANVDLLGICFGGQVGCNLPLLQDFVVLCFAN